MSATFPILFGILFMSVFVWFFLVTRLFKLLKSEHPGKYREMGEPTLFWSNSPKASWELSKFLLKRDYAELNDPKLLSLGNTMLAFFVLYMAGFLYLFFSVPFGYAH